MALFFTLLPLYLVGNIHCLGMCGPLVMMIGHHPYRYFYFIGRILSFGLAGMIAGALGAVLHLILKQYHIAETASFLFGTIIIGIGLNSLFGWNSFSFSWIAKPLNAINKSISALMLKDSKKSTLLFGFFTVLLPCGQTLVVFSACALAADPFVGLFNGAALALLTTPSLAVAMHTHGLLKQFKKYYNTVLGACSIAIGALAFCRGLAELGWIPHWILNPNAPGHYHIVIF